MTTNHSEKEALRDLALFTSGDVHDVLVASMVTMAADQFFAKDASHEDFAQNPANVLPYRSLRALERASIVHIAEALKQPLLRVNATIRRRADLINHRDSISHPLTIEWRRGEMKAFAAQEREWLDVTPALVWAMSRSVNDELGKYGLPPEYEPVEPSWHMAAMLRQILEFTVKAGVVVPTAQDLLAWLGKFKGTYMQFLDRHADGS